MKKSTSVSIGLMVVGGWLASNVAWGGPPPDPPRKGGIPQCEEQLLICEATSQAFPATGQTTCWYFDDEVQRYVEDPDCTNPASAGQDGDIQAGADLSYTDRGLTIIDNNTKLEWMKQDDNGGDCANSPGYLDKDCVFTWDGAFAFVANLNASFHGGYDDWRVPNTKELFSIVHFDNRPAISDAFNTGACDMGCTLPNCSCVYPANYWSSTSNASSSGLAHAVNFGNASSFNHVRGVNGATFPVRAVRGGL